nr:carboxypeptidase regulatory-like domain protein [uncultured bacterium]
MDVTTGEIKTASTNSFGYYTFSDLTANDFYRMTVSSKRYPFRSPIRSFTLNDDLAGMDFVSAE